MMKKTIASPPPVNRGGRPRVVDGRASVSTWLPSGVYDQLRELAKRDDASLSATVRQLLIVRLR